MKTELNVTPFDVVPGKKINAKSYSIRNYRLHQILKAASKMLFGMVENDSGNAKASVTPRNVRQHWLALGEIKRMIQFAKDHNDGALMSHERAYQVLMLDPKGLMSISNDKQQVVAMELEHFVQVTGSVDSAQLQGNITDPDFVEIELQLKAVEDAMIIWLGKGADGSDTGVEVPFYKHLGEIIPDVDADYAQTIEPSTENPAPRIPDVPDTEG